MLELIAQARRDLLDDQTVTRFIVFHRVAQQVRIKADRDARGAPGETLELVERLLVRRDFR